jgi:shikimate kinase/3-dehydroquinate synthase
MTMAPPFRIAKTIALVGLMGAGKSSIGRRLAQRLALPFIDADSEIEAAAGATIEEIFQRHGEAAFRDGERRVIARILDGPVHVLATGGGAFMDASTRTLLRARAISVWLRADIELMLARVGRRGNRPLLKSGEPRAVLEQLIAQRYPIYAQADITVDSVDGPPEATLERVMAVLAASFGAPGESASRAMSEPRRLAVAVDRRSYDIVIGAGLLDAAGALLRPVLRAPRVIIVTDEHVAKLHLPRLVAGLAAGGIAQQSIVLPAGEATKDFAHFTKLCEDILALGIERSTMLVALGGGVIGDITGFAAATLLRGIGYVQVPTTLLSQVDSSVGGKTAIDTPQGKNLVGAFHQPVLVLADIDTLATLPRRELLSGYAEVVKYGLIRDRGFYDWLETNGPALLAGDAAVRQETVLRSCAAKAAVVAADERESGERALLNFGHTFGHALETASGFGQGLLHGEAVAIGMQLAFELSARLGFCRPDVAARVRRHLTAMGLPTEIAPAGGAFSAATLLAHMRKDKKVKDGRVTLILARDIGDTFITSDVAPADLERFLVDAASRGVNARQPAHP